MTHAHSEEGRRSADLRKLFHSRCFTLIEMLVVIAVIGLLAALLLGALSMARSKARKTKCIGQLREFMHAIAMYRTDYEDFYPPWLSTLYPEYVPANQIYVCSNDQSSGKEGGKPKWFIEKGDNNEFIETNDNGDAEKPGSDGKPYARKEITDMRNDEIDACSYMYEFTWAGCSWWNGGNYRSGDPKWNEGKWADFNGDGVVSWREAKETEMRGLYSQNGTDILTNEEEAYGGHVPMIRCWWHNSRGLKDLGEASVLNVSCGNNNIYECKDERGRGWKRAAE